MGRDQDGESQAANTDKLVYLRVAGGGADTGNKLVPGIPQETGSHLQPLNRIHPRLSCCTLFPSFLGIWAAQINRPCLGWRQASGRESRGREKQPGAPLVVRWCGRADALP